MPPAASSRVSLPALTTIAADTTDVGSLTEVEALNGGDVELPALSQVSGGPVLFESDGTGSELNIADLNTINGPTSQDHFTTLETAGGGSLTASDLATLTGVDVLASGGSQLTLGALKSYVGGVGDLTTIEASAPAA